MLLVLNPENQPTFGTNKTEIVNQVFDWSLNDKGEVLYKAKYHYPSMSPKLCTPDQSEAEKNKEAVKYLWGILLGEYGYLHFKEVQ